MRKRIRPRFCGIIALFAAFLIIFGIESSIRPNIAAIANHQCANKAAEIINHAILSELDSAGELIENAVKINYLPNGKISSVVSNGYFLSITKEQISKRLITEFSDAKSIRTNVYLGAVLGIPTLSDGPRIPIYIYAVGMPETEISGTLITTGINQSIYRITLTYSAEITSLIAFHRISTVVTDEIVLAEIVFSGEVPQAVVNR